MRLIVTAALAILLFGIAGCSQKEAVAPPAPQEITSETSGHFCGMGLFEHKGPKGQVFVADRDAPFWFASVRETLAFLKLPEEPKNVVAIYVNDMGRAANWDRPEPGTWTDAHGAWYVIGSKRQAGMNGNEAVPFGDKAKAQAFVAENGGHVVRFGDIPDEYVFPGPGSIANTSDSGELKE